MDSERGVGCRSSHEDKRGDRDRDATRSGNSTASVSSTTSAIARERGEEVEGAHDSRGRGYLRPCRKGLKIK